MWISRTGIISSSGVLINLNTDIAHAINADNTSISSTSSIGGTGAGGITFGTGLINQCFVSNGVNSYIVYNTASLNFANSFSMSFWVKTTTSQSDTNGLVSSYDYTGTSYGYALGLTATNKVYLFWNNTSDNEYTCSNSIVLNQWNHVVVIWDKLNTNWKVYINNVLDINVTTAAANGIRYSNNEKSNICSVYSEAANSLNGSMDAIAMWNKVLTNSEINQLYNSGNGKQYPY